VALAWVVAGAAGAVSSPGDAMCETIVWEERGVDPGFPFRLTPMSFALRVTNSP